ncbi:MAG: PIG-L family deacetylase [Candidatus Dojkabacteria bacterium]|nr:PIG-L family deacetylase [Candidatus Dojkabacteria bacterium]MDQ7021135.1 PIG-L family deacetylase [Candidatus Dojkabacteria bacterium]
MNNSYVNLIENKNNFFFVTAHPDDVIVFFAGLIYKLRQDNKNVAVVTVTNGARGSRENKITEEELAKTRKAEEINALKVLGVKEENIHCLEHNDGEFESNYELIGEILKYIRKYKADLVGTHEPSVNYTMTYDKSGYFVQHRGHRKVGEAVMDSVYPFSRDTSFFP